MPMQQYLPMSGPGTRIGRGREQYVVRKWHVMEYGYDWHHACLHRSASAGPAASGVPPVAYLQSDSKEPCWCRARTLSAPTLRPAEVSQRAEPRREVGLGLWAGPRYSYGLTVMDQLVTTSSLKPSQSVLNPSRSAEADAPAPAVPHISPLPSTSNSMV